MSWFRRETRSLFIARPDSAAGNLVFMHPDTTIPRGARLTVRSDERAVFFRQGRAVGALEAGSYMLDSANLPFLGTLIIDPLTGGNHYITELFFVRSAETTLGCDRVELGAFVDVESKVLLRVEFGAEFTVRVRDGTRLITSLGGQSADSQYNIERIVQGRIRNIAKQIVAEESRSTPIQALISNASGENFGNTIRQRLADEFAASGLDVVRFLELHLYLDARSEADLRQYQSKVADLNIQAHGAALANQPGYSHYNLVQGQRRVLEGLGDGLAKGGGSPILGLGLGLGSMPGGGFGGAAPPQPGTGRGVPDRPPSRRRGGYLLRGPNGKGGPYSARQASLWIIASGSDPSSVEVCSDSDGGELWIPVSSEPAIMAEFSRRQSSKPASDSGGFESAFQAAISDGVVTLDEMQLLCAVAVATRTASNPQEAEGMVRRRCAAVGCSILGPEQSHPHPERFAYFNGVRQTDGLSAAEIAELVRASPEGVHLVWAPPMTDWVEARTVDAILHVLGPPATE